MSGRRALGWAAACGALLASAGCGYKGDLYLPERNATVVTHPAPAAAPPQAPAPRKKTRPSPPPPGPSTPPR